MQKEKSFPKTLVEAVRYFSNPQVAHDFVVEMRWPRGVICPRCGSSRVSYTANRRIWTCEACPNRRQFSVKVGTIMEESPIALDKWLVGMWLVMSAKNGISSYELGRALGITQKTAWFMGHRIRFALHSGSIEKMNGHCEADETFIGARARFMHKGKRQAKGTGPVAMTPVLGVLERAKDGKHSRVSLRVTKTRRKPELQEAIHQMVEKGSSLYTDSFCSYSGLHEDYVHQVVDHLECYAKGNVHTNGLENFWSLFKRALKGTYVNVEPFHLFRYCDEQAFRFNERKATDSKRFVEAVPAISGRRLTWKNLTGNVGEN